MSDVMESGFLRDETGALVVVADGFGPDAPPASDPLYVKGVVVHGAINSVARPVGFTSVEWIGSVQPLNALDNDTWVVT